MSTSRKRKKRGPAKRSTPESGKSKTGPSKGGGGKSGGGKGTSGRQEVMRDVIRGKCSKLALALLMELKLTFSSRHNASYSMSDMYRALLATCNRDGGASSIEDGTGGAGFRRTAQNCPAARGCSASWRSPGTTACRSGAST